MIKNIIFDVGKVLVSYEPEELMIRMGLSGEERRAVNAAMFENELWDLSDKGVYSEEKLLALFQAGAPGYEKTVRRVYDAAGDAIELLPYAEDWLGNLKERGFSIYILSNYGRHIYELTKEKMKFLKYADGAVFSYVYQQLKPEPEIYHTLLEKYGLKSSECVFVDDRPVNIEGAAAVGIRGIVFRDYAQAVKELDRILSE